MNQDCVELVIKHEDLSKDLQRVADIIGMDNTLRLCQAFGGRAVYFQMSKLTAKAKARQIKEDYLNGDSGICQ